MKYKLAKQLKDAGFSQEMRGGRYQFLSLSKNEDGSDTYDESLVYVPTLSELIEACGDSFGKLQRIHKFKYVSYTSESYERPLYEDTVGSTPEESVARLWLAINKK